MRYDDIGGSVLIYRIRLSTPLVLVASAILLSATGCSFAQKKIAQVNALRSVMVPGHDYKTYSIPSNAMAPTIMKGAIIMGDSSAYRDQKPQRNDVVVMYPPIPTNDPFVKRIVGVPGDSFELLNGNLTVNGRTVREPYLTEKTAYGMAVRDYGIYVTYGSGWEQLDSTTANVPPRSAWASPDRIPRGYYITLGDNRNDSEDSHIWGFAQMSGQISSGPSRGQKARPFVKVVKVLPAN